MCVKNHVPLVAVTYLAVCCATGHAAGQAWHAGTWDSNLYLSAEHPKTVGIRMELLDRDTHIPVSRVHVSLEGEYYQMWISQDIVTAESLPWWNIFVDPNKREPQPKEFKLDAVSGPDGVVVFALQWQKEFPWDSKIGDKWTYQVGDQWLVYLDDIEKVNRLEIRHPQYKYVEAPLDFRHLVGLKQYIEASQQGQDRTDRFEDNWKNEINRRNVKLFVLDLGSGFGQYKKQFCKQPEFFQRVRAKDYGMVYRNVQNLPNLAEDTKCGPYFLYDLGEILLEPIAARVPVEAAPTSILTRDGNATGTPWYSRYARQPQPTRPPQTPLAATAAPGAGNLLDQETTVLSTEIEKLKNLSLLTIAEIRSDPAKLAALVEKAGALKNELAIAGIRGLPMVDPDTGQMTTLDAYARKLAEDKQLGGSLGEDPIATAYMMLFDSNFLVDEARIIRLKDGQYVSLTDAIGVAATESDSGLDPEVLKRAVRTAATLHQASRMSNGQLMTKAFTSFLFAVSEANASPAQPPALDTPALEEGQVIHCPQLSMSLKTLTPQLCKDLGLHRGVQGALIVGIDPNAPPGHDDLKPGMVIESWFHRLVPDADALVERAKRAVTTPAVLRLKDPRDQALLGIWKYNGTSWERDYQMIWIVGEKPGDETVSPEAPRPGRPREKSIDLGNGVRMEFVLIPPGSFYMGSPSSEKDRDDDEGPVRRVQITKPFYVGKYEVTHDQYMQVMGNNPSHWSGRNLPVENVSWNGAVAFCNKIGGRLPTEAEWEYACRAGSETRFCCGDDLNYSQLGDYAWYDANSGGRTHAVGQKKANAFGLFDMHGNVWEWCSDWWLDNYRNAAMVDPTGPSSGKYRVLRGGCWSIYARYCRSANRFRSSPDFRNLDIGFRVVLDFE